MKKILTAAMSALLLSACSSGEEAVLQTTPAPETAKTPIHVVTNLTTDLGVAQTRAYNNTFEAGDTLWAYIQTVERTSTSPDIFNEEMPPLSSLEKFTLKNDATASAVTTTDHNDFNETIYWDDFSDADDYDLNDPNYFIRLKYGYCFNGGAAVDGRISNTFNKADGTLGWTVATDQSSGFKTSDLLWASTQTPIHYNHVPESRPTLTLPYSHAMSKMTLKIVLGDGFSSSDANFQNTQVILKGLNTVASVNAPAGTITGSTPAPGITMQQVAITTANMDYTYAALFVPTTLTEDTELAEITDIHGNKYIVRVTSDMLTNWNTNSLLPSNKTQPGVNYFLTVNIAKQTVSVNATLADWAEVNATGTGVIYFASDVYHKDTDVTNGSQTILQTQGFNVYWLKYSDSSLPDQSNAAYGNSITSLSYDASNTPKWSYSNKVYWPNKVDQYYFRAVSAPTTNFLLTAGDEASGNVLWGTTKADSGTDGDNQPYSYDQGEAIRPRTGDVPLEFIHAMSKVSISLASSSSTDPDYVDLTGATITLSNLAKTGTLNLHDGSTTRGDLVENFMTVPSTAPAIPSIGGSDGYLCVPQTFTDEAIIKITLADEVQTTYRLKLKDCVVTVTDPETGTETSMPILAWQSNKHYKYTITVKKQEVTFRALVKDWEVVNGSGNANLEWD